MIEFTDSALEKKYITSSIFPDLSKAFDTLDHNILLNKLDYYGIRGVANNLIKSYLSQRKQCVSYDNSLSDYKTITCGVPRGSILGPHIFLIYE
jgi:hypothetical protein